MGIALPAVPDEAVELPLSLTSASAATAGSVTELRMVVTGVGVVVGGDVSAVPWPASTPPPNRAAATATPPNPTPTELRQGYVNENIAKPHECLPLRKYQRS
jgi:hypothetical protein